MARSAPLLPHIRAKQDLRKVGRSHAAKKSSARLKSALAIGERLFGELLLQYMSSLPANMNRRDAQRVSWSFRRSLRREWLPSKASIAEHSARMMPNGFFECLLHECGLRDVARYIMRRSARRRFVSRLFRLGRRVIREGVLRFRQPMLLSESIVCPPFSTGVASVIISIDPATSPALAAIASSGVQTLARLSPEQLFANCVALDPAKQRTRVASELASDAKLHIATFWRWRRRGTGRGGVGKKADNAIRASIEKRLASTP